MQITASTLIYVIPKPAGRGSYAVEPYSMSLGGWINSLAGGSVWDDFVITTDRDEAEAIHQKFSAIASAVAFLDDLNAADAIAAVDKLKRG